MPKDQLALTRLKLSASIATIQDTLLESADQKEIKKIEGEMQEILDTKQETREGDLKNRMNIKLWLLLMEKKLKKKKEELKTKLENFQSSSKGHSKLLNSQMSDKDKSELGYRTQTHEGVSYENEVFESVFDSRSSDVEDSLVNDRFEKVEVMHAVPLPMIGIYMPPKSDFGIDESKFTYAPKQSKTSEYDVKTNNLDYC
nr:hypothetical protein [Tanacetum cinerariifolium]